ncbi:MAG: nucleotidyltransferase domain-containing protein [Armatimonadota bacterium]|nr:nucleotidyltransferase domain-containing protein [Armatimonadota bacterium]MDR7444686.1 nucleotidyltransferase domain-containing protein [Armatimonadota bacterium]MDR7569192.1 nucleotidyltransferase domain-containing protein [Armatimonadota bacterium]MDR7613310.1 nucleotidyltransferase domain-containing protein [Armatimonadota bacterium]
MAEDVRAIVRRVKDFLAGRYGSGIKAVILYGSYALGTATEDSDVDLLVVVEDSLDPWQVRRSLDALLFDILLETGELISVVVVPEGYYEAYASPFLANVRREGVHI